MLPILLGVFVRSQGLKLLSAKIPQILGLLEGTSLSKSLLTNLATNPLQFLNDSGIFENKNKLNKFLSSLGNKTDSKNVLKILFEKGLPKTSQKTKDISAEIKDLLKATGYYDLKSFLSLIKSPIQLTEKLFNSLDNATDYIGITIDLTGKSTALASGKFITSYEQNTTTYGILMLSFQGKSPSSGKYYAYPNVGLDTWVRMNTEAAKGAEGSYSIFIEDYLGGGLGKKEVGSFYRTKARQLERKIETTKYGNYKTKSVRRAYNIEESNQYIKNFKNYKKKAYGSPSKKGKK